MLATALLLARFPLDEPDLPWSRFRAAFPDPDHLVLGAEVSGQGPGRFSDDPESASAQIYGMTDFRPVAIAEIVRRCCAASLARGLIGFDWAITCSKPRFGEFGGSWRAIFADRIKGTAEPLAQALEAARRDATRATDRSQRWRDRRFRLVDDVELVDRRAYSVEPIPHADARAFVARHHYLRTGPSPRSRSVCSVRSGPPVPG